ncbi:unnamed protein product, partial [Adineta ricciae]
YSPSDYATQMSINSMKIEEIVVVFNSDRSAVPFEFMFKLYLDEELAKLAQARSNLIKRRVV